MMRVRVVIPLLAGLLAGCTMKSAETLAVAPVSPPLQWRSDASSGPAIGAGWWRDFGDPVLSALIEKALAHNTDVAIAAAQAREARAQSAAARAALSPVVDASLGASRSRSVDPFGEPLLVTGAEPELQVAYEVDLFGRLHDQASAARDHYWASEAARDATALSLSAAVADGYVTLRALDARLAVTRETLVARQEALRIAHTRAEHGYSPLLELRQAEAEYEAAAQSVPQLELALARQENSLSQLTGETPQTIARGAALFDLQLPAVPAGLPSELLRHRPDIAQAEYQLAAADASLAAARKRFLPQLKLSTSAGYSLATILPDPIALWSIGGSVLAPLFEGGRIEAQANAATAQRDQAALRYRKTALTAFRETEDQLVAVDRLAVQFQHLQVQREALAQALHLARNRYREGYSPYLEQLDAQRGLLSGELQLIQTRADQLHAAIGLYQALGGGWQPANPTVEAQNH